MTVPQILRARLSTVPPAGGTVPQHNIGVAIETTGNELVLGRRRGQHS